MIWKVFTKKRDERPVEILSVDGIERLIIVRRMPNSQKALIDALCKYWRDNEVEWSITEVLRYEKPAHVFYKVMWIEGDDDD